MGKHLLLNFLQFILKSLARATLNRYRPGVIGITGNVGKTSVKEAVKAVLGGSRRVRASSKNFNNDFGLPLTVLGDWGDAGGALFYVRVVLSALARLVVKSKKYPEILILEYGVDRPYDMKRLLQIARPHIGIVTAIGETPVHVEFFSGPDGLAREKSRLTAALPATGFAILNDDDSRVLGMKKITRARVITYGSSDKADVRFSSPESVVQKGVIYTAFKITHAGSTVPVRLVSVLGRAQAYAAAAASAAGVAFGLHLVKIADALGQYQPPRGRLNVIPGLKDSIIIDDTYNSSPLALSEALSALRALKARNKIAVLGDMLELGRYTIPAHRAAGREVAKSARALITVGAKAKFIAEAAIQAGLPAKNVLTLEKVSEAGRLLQDMLEEGAIVLIKGSQSVRMEKVVQAVMSEPERADELLVRQSERWLDKPGIYD